MIISRARKHPEKIMENKVRRHLEKLGWLTIKTHGNQFQSGLPDLYCAHPLYGQRWIEMKTPSGVMTAAQKRVFPKLHKAGVRIHIITCVEDLGTPGSRKGIFGPDNWEQYINKKNRYITTKPLTEETIKNAPNDRH